jgi:hypothetical protein
VAVIRGVRGLFGLALMGFLLKLNVLEIIGKGAWERLSIGMLGNFEQVFSIMGDFQEDLKKML